MASLKADIRILKNLIATTNETIGAIILCNIRSWILLSVCIDEFTEMFHIH